ncbi:hypothetical protein LBMAG18_02310 [Alphaproteobacteria bacterium]|nr:hypothetical protein LBMAG18_02310 [Alphaproteobacteria bacterium]
MYFSKSAVKILLDKKRKLTNNEEKIIITLITFKKGDLKEFIFFSKKEQQNIK